MNGVINYEHFEPIICGYCDDFLDRAGQPSSGIKYENHGEIHLYAST